VKPFTSTWLTSQTSKCIAIANPKALKAVLAVYNDEKLIYFLPTCLHWQPKPAVNDEGFLINLNFFKFFIHSCPHCVGK
jgi:hypothetical protein